MNITGLKRKLKQSNDALSILKTKGRSRELKELQYSRNKTRNIIKIKQIAYKKRRDRK